MVVAGIPAMMAEVVSSGRFLNREASRTTTLAVKRPGIIAICGNLIPAVQGSFIVVNARFATMKRAPAGNRPRVLKHLLSRKRVFLLINMIAEEICLLMMVVFVR